jgi:formylglycine-generating enzyme required for sulfatase activity
MDLATQRFRWIAPGEFWMGSTDEERALIGDKDYERWANERESPRHRVRLSEGYWLADTACTQALWLAVMGDNPSHFEGDDQLPVETVSFDDVQRFLAKLQALLPAGCEAVLPTEAQWEYACRAGTETPFSFGANITPEQVNYDGSSPYAGGPKGQDRGRTLAVKALPPNAWGLYEMHGNVWEWCADGLRNYARTALEGQAVEDPRGPVPDEQGALRAVRGGSWINDAGDVRSAYRDDDRRGIRGQNLGFRVALRSTSPAGPEGRVPGVRPEPEAQGPARRDDGPARGLADPMREPSEPAAPAPTTRQRRKPRKR